MADETSKKRLGRGLAALIGEMDEPVSTDAGTESGKDENLIPVEHLRANSQNPRRFFNESELTDLADSIREHGIVQPILVRPIVNEDLAGAKYEIIAGERRWRAAQKAGVHRVPVVIRAVEDKQALELAIIENVQRTDLNAVEEAEGYQQLIHDYDYSQSDLARVIGKSRSHVANTLRLLKLPEKVQALVTTGSLSAGHARTLVNAKDPIALAARILEYGLSVRQAEDLVQSSASQPSHTGSKSERSDAREADPLKADVAAMEKRLEDVLGLKVSLSYRQNGSGELRLTFRSLEQLDDVCRRLGGEG